MIASRSASGSWQKPMSASASDHLLPHARQVLGGRLGRMQELARRLAAQERHLAAERCQQVAAPACCPRRRCCRAARGIRGLRIAGTSTVARISRRCSAVVSASGSSAADVLVRMRPAASGSRDSAPAPACRPPQASRGRRALNSLRPLYCGGLWLAEICTPPAALCVRTSTPSVGVAAMPASSTSRPQPASPPCTTCGEHRPARPPVAADDDRPRRQRAGKRGHIAHGDLRRQAFADDAPQAGNADDRLAHARLRRSPRVAMLGKQPVTHRWPTNILACETAADARHTPVLESPARPGAAPPRRSPAS